MNPLQKIMSKKILSIPVETSLPDAFQMMKLNKVKHLVVIDDDEDVLGMVSMADLFEAQIAKNKTVGSIMTSPMVYIDHYSSVKDTIELMLSHHISSVMVSDLNEKAVGLVTKDDLLGYFVGILKKGPPQELPLLSASNRQTIGEIFNQISSMGI